MPRVPGGPRRRLPLFGEDDRDLALDLVVTSTSDGQSWDGMVFRPRGGDPRRRRLGVIVIHGSVGNYLTGVPRKVSFGLATAGFTVLSEPANWTTWLARSCLPALEPDFV